MASYLFALLFAFLVFAGVLCWKVLLALAGGISNLARHLRKAASLVSGSGPLRVKRGRRVGLILGFVIISWALFSLVPILGRITFVSTIGSRGAVKTYGVGVYWDDGCISPVSSVDWGFIEPGIASEVTFYVRNEGNVETSLFLSAENWTPVEASECLVLTWDYDGRRLARDEAVMITLSLNSTSGAEGLASFSFDIIISSVG